MAELIRVLHVVRAGAVKARTACLNELQALLVTAPAELREQSAGLKKARLADACSRLRPSADLTDPAQSVKAALRHLAARYRALSAEIDAAFDQLKALIEQARPELLTVKGLGVETAAQLLVTCGDNPDRLRSEGSFAALCGVSPVPASSGKHDVTASTVAAIGRPTEPCMWSCCLACPAIHPPAPTSNAEPPTGCPRERSSAA
ncbi:transposase [Nonomuraea thailandensis]